LKRLATIIATFSVPGLLSGCVVGPAPANLATAAWQPQQQPPRQGQAMIASPCTAPPRPRDLATENFAPLAVLGGDLSLLAPGDRLRLRVAGDEDRLSGVYVVAVDGSIVVPGLGRVAMQGRSDTAAAADLSRALVAAGLVRPLPHIVDLRLIESTGATVSVGGAVFEPGTVRAGDRPAENRIGQREGTASGDANGGRSIMGALRAAGGVRPDADLRHIYLIRGARWTTVDFSGAIDGHASIDVPIAPGDQVLVASTGCFDPALARATAVTMAGIRVYMSNLSRPANNNAGGAVGKDAGSLPYGTRMLQALVSMNCVGGSAMNARRRAVLISRNPITGQSVVVQREVERLVRDAGRDVADPYLMPNDALACYDSRWMNAGDAISFVSGLANTATPAILLRSALKK